MARVKQPNAIIGINKDRFSNPIWVMSHWVKPYGPFAEVFDKLGTSKAFQTHLPAYPDPFSQRSLSPNPKQKGLVGQI
jgi:hypothetical protein